MRRGGWLAPILMASLVRAAPSPSASRGILSWAVWSSPSILSASHQVNERGCLPSFMRLLRNRFTSHQKASIACDATKGSGTDADLGNINSMQTQDSKGYMPRGPKVYVPSFDIDTHVAAAWKHWEDMGKPKFVCAPMVDQSELSFRMMVCKNIPIPYRMREWIPRTIKSFSTEPKHLRR